MPCKALREQAETWKLAQQLEHGAAPNGQGRATRSYRLCFELELSCSRTLKGAHLLALGRQARRRGFCRHNPDGQPIALEPHSACCCGRGLASSRHREPVKSCSWQQGSKERKQSHVPGGPVLAIAPPLWSSPLLSLAVLLFAQRVASARSTRSTARASPLGFSPASCTARQRPPAGGAACGLWLHTNKGLGQPVEGLCSLPVEGASGPVAVAQNIR